MSEQANVDIRSYASCHAGKTIDDAITGFQDLQEDFNDLISEVQALKAQVSRHEESIKNKYDKAGGTIVGEASNKKVQISGGSTPERSALNVNYVDSYSTNSPLFLNGNKSTDVYIGSSKKARITYAGKVYGAVWNDFAEYRKSNEQEPGRVICENGDGSLSRSQKRLQAGANIISDTFGFAIGETDECKTPIAVAGRVLAFPYEDWWTFESGEPVCAGPNGTVSKMTRREVRKYPERIIGTVSELPTYEYWGVNKIPVNGRIWIKVK